MVLEAAEADALERLHHLAIVGLARSPRPRRFHHLAGGVLEVGLGALVVAELEAAEVSTRDNPRPPSTPTR